MEEDKKLVLVLVLDALKEGLTPAKISEKYHMNKHTLQHYIDGLKKIGCIKKVSYGVWEVLKKEVPIVPRGRGTKEVQIREKLYKQIRGHAFIWKVRFFIDNIEWANRLQKAKISYDLLASGLVQRIIFKGRKVWLTKAGMIVYEPLDFLGMSSWETKGKAVYELDQLIKDLGLKLDLDLSHYKFTTSREHYGIIKNELAKQYNDKGEKLYIRGEDGGVWMWIDNSHSLEELENKDPNINRRVQEWYNDHKKHNFEVNSSFILNGFNKQTENLDHYINHLNAHVESVKELGAGVRALTEAVTKIQEKI